MRKSTYHHALSDVYGRIDQVLLCVPENIDQAELERQLGGIFEALGGKVQFFVIGKIKSERDRQNGLTFYSSALRKEKYFPANQIIIVEPDFEQQDHGECVRQWIQDPFSILIGSDGIPILLEPYHLRWNDSLPDQNLAEQVSANTGYLMKSTRYFFEGGNILAGDDYIIVGKDILIKNLRHYYESAIPDTLEYNSAIKDITLEFQRIFGVEYVIWAGLEAPKAIEFHGIRQGEYGYQAFFHIDLYVSLGGKTADGDELIFLADLEQTELEMLVHPTMKEEWLKVKAILDDLEVFLSNHHRHTAGPKFVVKRVPFGLQKVMHGNMLPLSFNNCLTEVYGQVKVAYLPRYKDSNEEIGAYLDKLFERASEPFIDCGFRVVPVSGDFYDLAQAYGSLHCMVKVIHRKTQKC